MDSRLSLIRAASDQFRAARIEDPVHFAELLLTRCLNLNRSMLRLDPEAEVPAEQAEQYRDWTMRFAAGEPLAYLEGVVGFRNLELDVDPRVLVPRADSETIIDAGLLSLEGRSKPRIIDVCTGSGCLLLALLDEFPGATGLGVDLSADALAVARRNAQKTKLSGRASFREASYLGEADETPWETDVDLIVSNPPYIAPGEELGPGVAEYEPHLALFVRGDDPLAPYRAIFERAASYLRPGGALIFEVGAGRAAEVIALGSTLGFAHERTHRDLGGIERALVFAGALSV